MGCVKNVLEKFGNPDELARLTHSTPKRCSMQKVALNLFESVE